mgnify:CR=1 FL=1|tara:strand:+ start:743 stop:991 length:249 start_codon:yes stop_codon:yes gene_type:complete
MSLKSKGEIKDYDGNFWHVIHKSPYYINGIRMYGMHKVYFRRNVDDVLFKTGIFHEGEVEEILAGKGRIRLNTGSRKEKQPN